MSYTTPSKEVLSYWANQNRLYGMEMTDDQFFKYVIALKPDYLTQFDEFLEIYNDNFKAKNKLIEYADRITRGKVPASRLELQGFNNYLTDSTIIGFTQIPSLILQSTYETAAELSEAGSVGLEVGLYAFPVIAVLVLGLLVFLRFKK